MPSHETAQFLLVDDLEENLLALEALLQREGLEIFKAKSGPEALELLLVHEFGLAILDVQMAGMDGFELAELMRGTERTRRVPIIFLTANATDERRRFRGYEAGAVDYLLKPVDPQILRTKATIFLELDRQRRALARQHEELKRGTEQLAGALERIQAHSDNSPLAIVEFDSRFHVTAWSRGAERIFGWQASEVVGRPVCDLGWIHEGEVQAFAARSQDFAEGRQLRSVDLHQNYRKDGGIVECEWYNSALLDGSGKLLSVNAQILDITERRRAEETQKLLIGELNHRVKNTLATVQAIASQTLRNTADPAEFATNFTGRLHALAKAHSLLSNATWHGANLSELIHDQLRLGSADETRIAASGPEVYLVPQLAMHLALILHELGTNARKYGAFSTEHGRVALNWAVDDGRLHLRWEERNGPPVRAPSRRGFGTTLIEQSVKSEGGAARASYRADGVTWEISLMLPSQTSGSLSRDSVLEMPARKSSGQSARAESPRQRLSGRRFIVIEDEPLVSLVMVGALEDIGAIVAGSPASVEDALRVIAEASTADGAILDGNLAGQPVDEIAAALTRRNIPFLFVSGYGRAGLPEGFGSAQVLEKPFTQDNLLEALMQLVQRQAGVIQLKR